MSSLFNSFDSVPGPLKGGDLNNTPGAALWTPGVR